MAAAELRLLLAIFAGKQIPDAVKKLHITLLWIPFE
jgi:hypothetical protein